MKNILMLGRGSKAGAWRIRGEQLGKAIGATICNGLLNSNLVGYDLVIMVKRPEKDALERLHTTGIPIVWDVVDAWPQPIGNWWEEGLCRRWLRDEINWIKPKGIVVTTKVMEEDCARFGLPLLLLPHHARPQSVRSEIRNEVKKVVYEGGEDYLGRWDEFLRSTCTKRGWIFSKNAPSLNTADIVVAMREQNGYAAKNYKSNIKLANAQGIGAPCVLNREAAYLETATGAELWADTREELEAAFDELTPRSGRQSRSETLYAGAPRLEQIAATYHAWLEKL